MKTGMGGATIRRTVLPRGRGFTLVELLVSIAIMSVVLGGITSAVLLAAHAIDDGTSPLSEVVSASRLAEQLAAELTYALTVNSISTNAVAFTVADRDNDGADETIAYAWSGTPGDPLSRQYNGGGAVNVAEDVQEFVLTFDQVTTMQQGAVSGTESAETLLFSFTGTGMLMDFTIDAANWPGECFQPSLAADALSWKVTRVKLEAQKAGGNTGTTLVQLRTVGTGTLPSTTVLDEQTMYESALSGSYAWQEFSFNNASGISPTDVVCLVLEHGSDAQSAQIQYQVSGAFPADGAFVRTPDAGSKWLTQIGSAMLLYVYGTVTTAGQPQVTSITQLTGVSIGVRLGAEPACRVETSVATLNTPEVTGP